MSRVNVAEAVERARQEMIATYGKEEVMFPHDLLTDEEREAYYADMHERSEQAAAEEYLAQRFEEHGDCLRCGYEHDPSLPCPPAMTAPAEDRRSLLR